MYPPSPTDLPQLKKARTTIRAFLSEWLTENTSDDEANFNNIKLTLGV